ncbi:hypothetical protein CK203_047133 [Vitis vinifera]|uniref:Uncharacterized protein n=1 Tax=Vitis vinifera TaxID=29760 RepID=A0A438GSR2_VITVI|nr:hypothetical protein CK203_047133 [Vitis vinifera]
MGEKVETKVYRVRGRNKEPEEGSRRVFRGNARPSVLEVEVEEEVYVVSLWWECRPVIRRSCRQVDGRRSSEVRGEESSRAEKRMTKVWVSVRLENLHPPDDGTGDPLKPNCESKGVKRGPVSLSNKGPNQQPDIGVKTREGPSSSAGQDHNISQKKDLLLTGLDPGYQRTDKALEEESMRYGRGCVLGGKGLWGSLISILLIFDRAPGGESFDHSGDWNEEVRADNTMWLTVYEGCIEREQWVQGSGSK